MKIVKKEVVMYDIIDIDQNAFHVLNSMFSNLTCEDINNMLAKRGGMNNIVSEETFAKLVEITDAYKYLISRRAR